MDWPDILPGVNSDAAQDDKLRRKRRRWKQLCEFLDENSSASEDDSFSSMNVKPFHEELKVVDIHLSNEDFESVIVSDLRNIKNMFCHPNRCIYPTNKSFAELSSRVYKDYKNLLKPLKLESDWKLLTTATSKDGYFGAAYWNPHYQAVVIAHKGTRLTSYRDLKTDYKGILLKQIIPRVSSAATFSNKIAVKLKELCKQHSAFLTLSFTGHSLGGWLAQITSFTTQYLTVKKFEGKEIFVKSEEEAYHTHTVVFDSPGCKDMLSKLEDNFQERYKDKHHLISLLDVTIFLSAPNFVNTIHSHLDNGNLYRVFIKDLHKKTSFLDYIRYTQETHKMDNIKEVFVSEENSTTKETIMEIIDWPLAEEKGLVKLFFNRAVNSRLDEYRYFFKLANCTNNYNPTMDDYNGCSVRYRVKKIENFGRCSANIFNHAEFYFLIRYRMLQLTQIYFKSEDLCCLLEQKMERKINNYEVSKILNEFQLKRGKGRGFVNCKSKQNLINLIFCVKSILFFFPNKHIEMKEELKNFCISDNNDYVENIYKSKSGEYLQSLEYIELQEAAMQNVVDFLNDSNLQFLQQSFEMHRLIGVKKIHKVLENAKNEYQIENSIFLSLTKFIDLEYSFELTEIKNNLFKESPVLFVVECDTEPNEAATLFKDLFNTLRYNHRFKFILITQKCKNLKFCLEDNNNFYCEMKDDSKIRLVDLTNYSQRQVLDKKIYFQGEMTSLSTLIREESKHLVDEDTLFKLINNDTISIGEALPDLGDVESYYIERNFYRHVEVKSLIKEEKSRFLITYDNQIDTSELEQGKDIVLISDTESYFDVLCDVLQNYNVHWLKEKDNQIEWKKSHGNLSSLREYMDMDNVSECRDVDGAVVVLSSVAGEGSTTILTRQAQIIKKRDASIWVVKINLKAYTSNQKRENFVRDKNNIFNVLLNLANLNTPLETKLLAHKIDYHGKIALLLDGYESIALSDRGKLLKVLKNCKIEKLFITTRPHIKEELEDVLGVLSYSLKPLTKNDQEVFLNNYWSKTLGCRLKNGECLNIYAKKLIDSVSHTISDREKEFTGIPLHAKMLAEAFENDCKKFYNDSHQNKASVPQKLNIEKLYHNFVSKKFSLNIGLERIPEEYRKILDLDFLKRHGLLALSTLFRENDLKQFLSEDEIDETLSYEFQEKEGFISKIVDGRPHFIHISFANYFAARFLSSEKFIKKQKAKLFLLEQIFRKENGLLCLFLDHMLAEDKYKCGVHIAVLNNDKDKVKELLSNAVEGIARATDRVGRTALHLSAAYGHLNITNILLENGFNVNQRDQLFGWSPLDYAQKGGHWKIVEILKTGATTDDLNLFVRLFNLKTQITEILQTALLFSLNAIRWLLRF